MRILWGIVLLLGTFPVAAQSEQCVEVSEFWSDDMRHEVNLDTGAVTSFDAPNPYFGYASVDSPDGRYNATVDPEQEFRLVLADHQRGVSITLAENVNSPAWSPDGAWLAYVQVDANGESMHALTLVNMDSGAHVSVELQTEIEWDRPSIAWSPDGSVLAAMIVVDLVDRGRSTVQLYSAPDFALLRTFDTPHVTPQMEWSPSGRYLTTHSSNAEVTLIDTRSTQVFTLTLGEPSSYYFLWSPGERFLAVKHAYSDFNDELNVVNMQGELVLEDVIITSHEWVDDHQLLASVWLLTGLDDLTLFDLDAGTQRVIQRRSGYFALSPDGRYVAAHASYLIRFFDLSLEQNVPIRTLHFDGGFNRFIWSDHELVVLFGDQSLRGYDFETGTWRTIATIPPGDNDWLRRVPCAH